MYGNINNKNELNIDTSKAIKVALRNEIKEGDSLYSVFGDKWRDVYNANKDKISDPNFIEVGLVLNIPDGIEIK